jgi:hypothetical protein
VLDDDEFGPGPHRWITPEEIEALFVDAKPYKRRKQRVFWGWSDGEHIFTGLYLFGGRFFGIVRLAGERSPLSWMEGR